MLLTITPNQSGGRAVNLMGFSSATRYYRSHTSSIGKQHNVDETTRETKVRCANYPSGRSKSPVRFSAGASINNVFRACDVRVATPIQHSTVRLLTKNGDHDRSMNNLVSFESNSTRKIERNILTDPTPKSRTFSRSIIDILIDRACDWKIPCESARSLRYTIALCMQIPAGAGIS